MESSGEGKLTGVLTLTIIITVLGSTFQYGYNVAVINAPAKIIMQFFFLKDGIPNANSTQNVTTAAQITDDMFTDQQTLLWALTVSIYTVGGMIGSYMTGICMQKLGRKGALLASNVLSLLAATLMGFSKIADSLEMIIIGRFFIGVFAGLSTGIVPAYITEIAPKHLRGSLGVVSQLAVTIGILTAQLFGLPQVMGTPESWPLLLATTGVFSIIQLAVLPFFPESPRYLLIEKKQEPSARAALVRFRGTKNVWTEMEEMRSEAAQEANLKTRGFMEVVTDRTLKWQLISSSMMHLCQQLCGINAVFFYLNRIFESAGIPAEQQNYASIAVGCVNVALTVVAVLITDRLGRKVLLGGGYAIAGLFCVFMTIALVLKDSVPSFSYISIACVIGFIVGFAVGPGPLAWVLTAELFTQSSRPIASAISVGLNWSANFAVGISFPFMQKFMQSYVFLFFFAVCLVGTIFIYYILPETRNKTFREINRMFAKLNKLSQDEMDLDDEQSKHIVNSSIRSDGKQAQSMSTFSDTKS